MENINPSNAAFTQSKMIPDVGNELTFLWGRCIVNNLVNSYGLIGTIDTTGFAPFYYDDKYPFTQWKYQIFNLNLTKLFNYPPTVYFYGSHLNYGGLYSIFGKIRIGNLVSGAAEITYQISGDCLAVIVPVTPNQPHSLDKIYYRIIG